MKSYKTPHEAQAAHPFDDIYRTGEGANTTYYSLDGDDIPHKHWVLAWRGVTQAHWGQPDQEQTQIGGPH